MFVPLEGCLLVQLDNNLCLFRRCLLPTCLFPCWVASGLALFQRVRSSTRSCSFNVMSTLLSGEPSNCALYEDFADWRVSVPEKGLLRAWLVHGRLPTGTSFRGVRRTSCHMKPCPPPPCTSRVRPWGRPISPFSGCTANSHAQIAHTEIGGVFFFKRISPTQRSITPTSIPPPSQIRSRPEAKIEYPLYPTVQIQCCSSGWVTRHARDVEQDCEEPITVLQEDLMGLAGSSFEALVLSSGIIYIYIYIYIYIFLRRRPRFQGGGNLCLCRPACYLSGSVRRSCS